MRRDKSPTISNEVAYAIEDIMAAHLDDYLPKSLLKGVSFHHQSEEIHAPDCPAVPPELPPFAPTNEVARVELLNQLSEPAEPTATV